MEELNLKNEFIEGNEEDDEESVDALDVSTDAEIEEDIDETIKFINGEITIDEDKVFYSTDTIKCLLHDVEEFTQLTKEQEIDLAKKKDAGDIEARNALMLHNIKLVIFLSQRKFSKLNYTKCSVDDMVQAGIEGLDRGINKYDWSKGFRFSTYAALWINQSIDRYLGNYSRTIRIPVHVVEKIIAINKASNVLLQKLNRDPSSQEISIYLNYRFSEKEIDRLIELSKMSNVMSLDIPASDEGENQVSDLIEDTESVSPYEYTERIYKEKEISDLMKKYLKKVPYLVLSMRAGINGYEEMSFDEISNELFKLGHKNKDGRKISRQRVQQILEDSTRRLQKISAFKKLSQ